MYKFDPLRSYRVNVWCNFCNIGFKWRAIGAARGLAKVFRKLGTVRQTVYILKHAILRVAGYGRNPDKSNFLSCLGLAACRQQVFV